jgi:hypothetical protein
LTGTYSPSDGRRAHANPQLHGSLDAPRGKAHATRAGSSDRFQIASTIILTGNELPRGKLRDIHHPSLGLPAEGRRKRDKNSIQSFSRRALAKACHCAAFHRMRIFGKGAFCEERVLFAEVVCKLGLGKLPQALLCPIGFLKGSSNSREEGFFPSLVGIKYQFKVYNTSEIHESNYYRSIATKKGFP